MTRSGTRLALLFVFEAQLGVYVAISSCQALQ
jgi:hypothetical protein